MRTLHIRLDESRSDAIEGINDAPEIIRDAPTVGFLDIVDDHARPGPALVGWPDPDDEAVREMWLAALPAALAATTRDLDEAEARTCARALLTGLGADPDATPAELRSYGREAVGDERSEAVLRFFTGWYQTKRTPGSTNPCRETASTPGSGSSSAPATRRLPN